MDEWIGEWCETIVEMMEQGASISEVALALGVTEGELLERGSEVVEIGRALEKGVTLARAWWEKQARENLMNPKFNAVLYRTVMEEKFGWKDKKKGGGGSSDEEKRGRIIREGLKKLELHELERLRMILDKMGVG